MNYKSLRHINVECAMPAIRVSQRTKEEMEKMKEEMGFSTFNEIVREGNLHLQYAEERKAPKPASSD